MFTFANLTRIKSAFVGKQTHSLQLKSALQFYLQILQRFVVCLYDYSYAQCIFEFCTHGHFERIVLLGINSSLPSQHYRFLRFLVLDLMKAYKQIRLGEIAGNCERYQRSAKTVVATGECLISACQTAACINNSVPNLFIVPR